MMRAPLLSAGVLKELSKTSSLTEVLKKYYSEDHIREALFLASPALFSLAEKWINEGINEKEAARLEHSLLKYLIRMSSRCTPFGMFAGICSGTFGNSSNILLNSRDTHQLFIRPDMQFLCSLTDHISADREVRDKLLYRPNTSLARIGKDYRYIEYLTDEDGIRRYRLQGVEHSGALEKVICLAAAGAGINDLAASISDEEVDLSEAIEYIHVLIDNQFLVSGLEPNVTGDFFLNELNQQFSSTGIMNGQLLLLKKFNDQILKLHSVKNLNRIEAYESILESMQGSGIRYQENFLIQADLKLSFQACRLSTDVREDIRAAIPLLVKLSRPGSSNLLTKFREAFVRRYDMQEVPLTLALDAEAGPGYLPDDQFAGASALLEGLKIPHEKEITHRYEWNPVDRMLYRKLQESLRSGLSEIIITDEDVESLPGPGQPLPMSFSAMVRLHGCWKKDPARRVIQVNSVGGSSAANLAGRFCFMDQELEQTIKKICVLEQSIAGEDILAEIVHLPQQRTGNILARPVIRKYEIPFLARAGVKDEYVIPITDLMISVRHDKVLLRSKRLDRYIQPRLSNAHNYAMGSLSVYRFLCDLQTQNTCSSIGFAWGPLEDDTIFLPRVCYKNLILQAATWNFDKNELQKIRKANSEEKLSRAVDDLRRKYNMPPEVVLAMGDNELWLDLDSRHCRALLRDEAGKMDSLSLHEFIFDHENSIVRGEEGKHANEFIFFIHQDR